MYQTLPLANRNLLQNPEERLRGRKVAAGMC